MKTPYIAAPQLARLLQGLKACRSARTWAKGKSLAKAWQSCNQPDWMLWLCSRMIGKRGWPSHRDLVLALCDLVEPVLEYAPDVPRVAIEQVRTASITAKTNFDDAVVELRTYISRRSFDQLDFYVAHAVKCVAAAAECTEYEHPDIVLAHYTTLALRHLLTIEHLIRATTLHRARKKYADRIRTFLDFGRPRKRA